MVFLWNRGNARFTEVSTPKASAREAGVQVCPGHSRLFDPVFLEACRRVRAGEIGRVLHLPAQREVGQDRAQRPVGLALGLRRGVWASSETVLGLYYQSPKFGLFLIRLVAGLVLGQDFLEPGREHAHAIHASERVFAAQ